MEKATLKHAASAMRAPPTTTLKNQLIMNVYIHRIKFIMYAENCAVDEASKSGFDRLTGD